MDEEITENVQTKVYVRDGEVVLEFSSILIWIAWPPDTAEEIVKLVLEKIDEARKQKSNPKGD